VRQTGIYNSARLNNACIFKLPRQPLTMKLPTASFSLPSSWKSPRSPANFADGVLYE
jgi:hypothetical protein